MWVCPFFAQNYIPISISLLQLLNNKETEKVTIKIFRGFIIFVLRSQGSEGIQTPKDMLAVLCVAI